MIKVSVFDRNVRFLKITKKQSDGKQTNALGIVGSVLLVERKFMKTFRTTSVTKVIVRGSIM